ncbi:MAG TPA: LamG-like jellyroll fold domain-containing protein [Planctomycetota bacterium]|nr:LamG-like jellyroll fold domain-containing protein [Planctomycetota bacterium]
MLQLALLLLVAAQDAPAARWTFDGDVRDSGSRTVPTKAGGRLDYLDSPVGGSGKAAVFNAVDSVVEVDPVLSVGTGSDPFSLSFWMFVLDKRPVTLFWRKGWALSLLDAGGLRFSSGPGSVGAGTGTCPPGQWCHVVVSQGARVRIFVNGEQVGTGEPTPGSSDAAPGPLLMGRGPDEARPFGGLLDDVRLYNRALDLDQVTKLTDEGLPWLRPKAHAKTPFPGKFELLQDDVVVFTGGEDARVSQELGYLETLLALSAAGRRVHYRSMAWEGDTVFEQPRPLNFGSWTDQFRRCGASVIVAQFGQIEALQGKDGVDRFAAGYESLLGQFAQWTKRIVLLSPAPFGKGAAAGPDLRARNGDLPLYVAAIRRIAEKNGYLFVDLSAPSPGDLDASRDGVHRSGPGQWRAARDTARQLEIPGVSDLDAPDVQTGAFKKDSLEALRTAIRAKNGLWTDSWRPSNWAFLNGDRIEQPSSRDHVDRRIRWFPVEIQMFPALLRRDEDKIESLLEKR